MSTEIALRSASSMAEKVDYCRLLADSGLLPDAYRKQPANVLYAVEYGETIGVPPMAAITGIHIIKGKPSASAGLVGALVRKAGHKLRVRGDDTSARAVIIRADDPDFEYVSEWTLERAVMAKLCTLKDGKPYARDSKGDPTSWEKYPAAMLKHRAVTEVARDACEEVLFGLHYTPEELGAEVDADGEPVAPVRVEQVFTAQDAAEAVVRKAQAEQREQVDIAPRDQANPFDPDFELPASVGSASNRKASNAQLGRIAQLVAEKRGVAGKSEEARLCRLAVIMAIVGREVSSGSELTMREAGEVIDLLTLEPAHIADAEVVPDAPAGLGPVAAEAVEDLRSRIEQAASVAEVDAVREPLGAALKEGRINLADHGRLREEFTRRRGRLVIYEQADEGWSSRRMAEQGLSMDATAGAGAS